VCKRVCESELESVCVKNLSMNLVRLGAGNSLAWFPPRVVIGRCLSVHTVCVFETQRAKERQYMWRGTPNVARRLWHLDDMCSTT
jgi:hypothetical protein